MEQIRVSISQERLVAEVSRRGTVPVKVRSPSMLRCIGDVFAAYLLC